MRKPSIARGGSPSTPPERARGTAYVVLGRWRAGFISAPAALALSSEPVPVVPRALESQAPYFGLAANPAEHPDLAGVTSSLESPTLTSSQRGGRRYAAGLIGGDEILARRKRRRPARPP